MLIRHKGIYHDRFEDAPWIGTLISAISCDHNCPGCINDKMKSISYQSTEINDLFRDISSDKFNEGIILAGLEWTLQPNELIAIIDKALERDMSIILYTYHPNKDSLIEAVPDLYDYSGCGILVKYGEYDESKKVSGYESHGVILATSNQYIEEL